MHLIFQILCLGFMSVLCLFLFAKPLVSREMTVKFK